MSTSWFPFLLPILVGLAVGGIYNAITGGKNFGILIALVVGVIGAIIGNSITIRLFDTYHVIGKLLASALGSFIPLWVVSIVKNRRSSLKHDQDREFTGLNKSDPDAKNGKRFSKANEEEPTDIGPTQVDQVSGKPHAKKIFISYRRDESADITGRIYDRLLNHFGMETLFKDVDSIPLGADFRQYIDEIIVDCEVLLAVIGQRWLDMKKSDGTRRIEDPRDHVRIEIESALKRDILVIPLLVQGATLPHEDSLPSTLKPLPYRNGILIRPDPDFHKDMERLISGLEVIGSGHSGPTQK